MGTSSKFFNWKSINCQVISERFQNYKEKEKGTNESTD